ncbi:hypothetical protein BD779DRAFT_1672356 [Infundibulicybe gibba]|nr:hypothetical protein BD779DRAFT_1672356 [Infundibulicybe gibba]
MQPQTESNLPSPCDIGSFWLPNCSSDCLPQPHVDDPVGYYDSRPLLWRRLTLQIDNILFLHSLILVMNPTPVTSSNETHALVSPLSRRLKPVPTPLEPTHGRPERHSVLNLQFALRRLLGDSSSSQSEVFNSCAPVVAFLYLLLVGMIVPRWVRNGTSWFATAGVERFTLDSTPTVAAAVLLPFAGLFGVLVALRLFIWLGSVLAQELAMQDLEPLFGSGELSHANLIFGAILD